jgi:nitrate reductase assembly molybdenum cofactor insertion protein NarJ
VELAAEDPEVGQGVLDEYREELARIAASLRRAGSPWAPVVEAVAA